MNTVFAQMKETAYFCATEIQNHDSVSVVSHIDADGLTSAAIICTALERAGLEYDIRFVKQLDETIIEEIANINPEVVIFTDLGSGMLETMNKYGINAVVSDHHQPQGTGKFHLNPHLFGINGSYQLSGSGTTYILANELGDNRDLAGLAIVGAVGDLQHLKKGELTGINRIILEEGSKNGVVSYNKDITLFGKQTRPVFKLLQFASDPYLPGLTGDEDACIKFLADIGIRFSGDERWRRWIDLEIPEKQKIVSALVQHCVQSGIPSYKVERMIGEVYLLLNEKEGQEMRDASEFSTLLNATARYEHADVGLAVCMGDRGEAYDSAKTLLYEHRQNLVKGLMFVKENGIIQMENLQYFDAGNNIKETIVGIIAGMSTTAIGNRNKPIIAFADADSGVKVSARGSQDLIRRGLNLSKAMSEASAEVGGAGGGHDIAAGATIPAASKQEFVTRLNQIIGQQVR
ncbi:single-stranded-DNA-specific exonuclease RecJ [Methanohalophilus levihalophilus]|uniref:single-stranded-DNA-specific exonuclease RecJ n=1 Tax=Methanohalophilus levihalophilus TaxID=1431282 RepID=UPI001AE252AD|nr:DHH family phosphoesterase [Methanohalophilus levihalophilus]